jgi:hypothetical protein
MALDVPEILIILGILGIAAWAIYNRLHGGVTAHRQGR